MKFFTSSGIPAVFALLAIAAEFFGPFGLAVGFLTRVAAFGIACVIRVRGARGYDYNSMAARLLHERFGNQKGEGFEYRLVVQGIAITLMIIGGGTCSLDALLAGPR